MTLAMARLWKHPKTGIDRLRKRVPDDLQKLVGKREEKQSLGTRDPAEAKRKHLAALTAVEERWACCRFRGPRDWVFHETGGGVCGEDGMGGVNR